MLDKAVALSANTSTTVPLLWPLSSEWECGLFNLKCQFPKASPESYKLGTPTAFNSRGFRAKRQEFKGRVNRNDRKRKHHWCVGLCKDSLFVKGSSMLSSSSWCVWHTITCAFHSLYSYCIPPQPEELYVSRKQSRQGQSIQCIQPVEKAGAV